MDRINAMKVFVRVAEAGNFTRAAETLKLPKPTVTRLIQALESQLQIKLIHRTTRALTLTLEGAAYYERVVLLLADLEDIESSAKGSLARPGGKLRIDVSVSVGCRVIIPALASFYAAYPDMEIDLRIGNREVDMVADSSDCAIRIGEIHDQSLVARRIGTFRLATCATPAYLQTYGTPVHPGDLNAGHRTVALVAGTRQVLPFTFLKGAESIKVKAPSRLSVNDTNAYLAAGLAGLGILQAPDFTVQAAINDGLLVPIIQDWNSTDFPISIVYSPNRFLSAKVRAFVDWAINLMHSNPHFRRNP